MLLASGCSRFMELPLASFPAIRMLVCSPDCLQPENLDFSNAQNCRILYVYHTAGFSMAEPIVSRSDENLSPGRTRWSRKCD